MPIDHRHDHNAKPEVQKNLFSKPRDRIVEDEVTRLKMQLEEKERIIKRQGQTCRQLAQELEFYKKNYEKMREKVVKFEKKVEARHQRQEPVNTFIVGAQGQDSDWQSLQLAIQLEERERRKANEMQRIMSLIQEEEPFVDPDFLRALEESKEQVPNPDEMTYEELKRLGDRIGEVSRGYSKEKIQELPSIVWGEGREEEQCAICFDQFVHKDLAKELGCTHLYHAACIDKWLLTAKKCPVCNEDVLIP